MRRAATAILLVGGQSTRMGTDKALLPWGDTTLIAAQHAALAQHFDEIVIASGTADRYAAQGLPGIADAPGVQGPMAGLIAGLRAARHDTVLTWPCDVPMVDEHALALLEALAEDRPAAVIIGPNGMEPLCAAYHRAPALAQLQQAAASGDFSVKASLAAMGPVVVRISGILPNFNTPDDYASA